MSEITVNGRGFTVDGFAAEVLGWATPANPVAVVERAHMLATALGVGCVTTTPFDELQVREANRIARVIHGGAVEAWCGRRDHDADDCAREGCEV